MATQVGDRARGYSSTPELVTKFCDDVQIGNDRRIKFAVDVSKIAATFASRREIQPFFGVPGEQRAAIRKLIQLTVKTIIQLRSVSTEYLVAFDPMLKEATLPPGSDAVALHAESALIALLEGAINFDNAYKPNKGAAADIELEEAVRELIELLKEHELGAPEVTPGRDAQPPKLRNREAIAIGDLLRAIDPQTEVRSIVNMIAKVKRGHRPTEPHFYKIWETDPNHEYNFGLPWRQRPRI